MRHGLTPRGKDRSVKHWRRSRPAINHLKMPLRLIGALPFLMLAENACAFAPATTGSETGAYAVSPHIDRQAAKLYTPGGQSSGEGESKILLAHAIVVKTSPPQGGVASGTIGKVDVWYDAGIRDSLAALAVVSASGERIDKRDAAIDSADPAHVSVSVNPMTPGKYTVRYRALSADGHMVSGAWEFDVQP